MSTNPYTGPATRCAGPNCDQMRKDTNHWFVTLVADGAFGCWPFDPKIPIQADEKPVCGQQCAQKLFEQYLSEGK